MIDSSSVISVGYFGLEEKKKNKSKSKPAKTGKKESPSWYTQTLKHTDIFNSLMCLEEYVVFPDPDAWTTT